MRQASANSLRVEHDNRRRRHSPDRTRPYISASSVGCRLACCESWEARRRACQRLTRSTTAGVTIYGVVVLGEAASPTKIASLAMISVGVAGLASVKE